MTVDTEVLKKSVTKEDHEVFGNPGGPVWFFTVPFNSIERQGMLPLEMPMYWSREGDALLRSTILREAMWSNVIFKIITRISSFGWDIEDASLSEQRVSKAQKLLHGADLGMGWVTFISKIVRDFACTNNGAFIEIIRSSGAAGSRVIGLRHLDSLRCWRTGDVNFPVIYFDLKGAYHVLKAHQVLSLVDMPSSDPLLRGVGWCAAARAYNPMVRLQYLQNYVTEKISGTRPLALYFVNGATQDQIQTAVNGGMAQAQAEGYISYMGAIVVPTFRPEAPQVATIDLAGLPDKADADTERKDCYLHMAHAAGIFVGEIQPLEGQYGTGTQSTVLSDASKGQGFTALTVQLEHGFSQKILPFTTTFAFAEKNDWRDQEQKAKVVKLRVDTRAAQITSGELTKEQAQQMAADFGDINRTFLSEDMTPNASLGDDEKPSSSDGKEDNAEVTDTDPKDAKVTPEPTAKTEKAATLFLVMKDALPLCAEDVTYTLKHLAGQHDQMSHAPGGSGGGGASHADRGRQLENDLASAQRTVYDKMRAARASGSYAGISQARRRVRDAQTALDTHMASAPTPTSVSVTNPAARSPEERAALVRDVEQRLRAAAVENDARVRAALHPEQAARDPFDIEQTPEPDESDAINIHADEGWQDPLLAATKKVPVPEKAPSVESSDLDPAKYDPAGLYQKGRTKNILVSHDSDEADVEETGRDLFGDDFALEDLADLVGAPSDSLVTISNGFNSDTGEYDVLGKITVRTTHTLYRSNHRTIFRNHLGEVEVHNDIFELVDTAPPGTGTSVFNQQVTNSRRLGVDKITTQAARLAGMYNGYYTWPRLGYDADISHYKQNQSGVWDLLPRNLRSATRVSDLMKTKEGRDFWKDFGESTNMEFDLDKDSLSSYVLSEYVKSRMANEG